MKIKLKNNTVHLGKVLKKDALVDLPKAQALKLVADGHAGEHVAPAEEPPVPPAPPQS